MTNKLIQQNEFKKKFLSKHKISFIYFTASPTIGNLGSIKLYSLKSIEWTYGENPNILRSKLSFLFSIFHSTFKRHSRWDIIFSTLQKYLSDINIASIISALLFSFSIYKYKSKSLSSNDKNWVIEPIGYNLNKVIYLSLWLLYKCSFNFSINLLKIFVYSVFII